jgi:DNA-binding transcriptional MerR regulator
VGVRVSVKRTSRTPLYSIGVASRLCGISIHRLRWVERAGLVAPNRTGGNQRLFCDNDLEILSVVRKLLAQRVNLQGIRVILRMQSGGKR